MSKYYKDLEPDVVSKTQLKNHAQVLKKFGMGLVELSDEKLKMLPVEEVTLKSLLDYKKINSNLARKRHLMFIGKCLRNENQQEIEQFLEKELSPHKETKVVESENDPVDTLIEDLINIGEEKITEILIDNPQLERQKLRQFLRNISNAKTEQKKQQAIGKIKAYLQSFSD